MWGLRRWLSMSMSMSIGDVFWRFCFAVAANLFSIFCQALSSHNSHCIMCGLRGQTLDPTDATHNTQHTRGLHAILNGFIDTLGCRNNKLSRGSGRGRGAGLHVCKHWQQQMPGYISIVTEWTHQAKHCQPLILALVLPPGAGFWSLHGKTSAEFIMRIICEFWF